MALDKLRKFSLLRSEWLTKDDATKINALVTRIRELVGYLQQFQAIRDDVSSYAVARFGRSRSGVFMKQHFEPFQQNNRGEEMEQQIKNTEISLLEPLLKWNPSTEWSMWGIWVDGRKEQERIKQVGQILDRKMPIGWPHNWATEKHNLEGSDKGEKAAE